MNTVLAQPEIGSAMIAPVRIWVSGIHDVSEW